MGVKLHVWRVWTYINDHVDGHGLTLLTSVDLRIYMIEGCGLTWLKGKDLHDWRMWTYMIKGGELTLLIGVDSQCTLLINVELQYW